jgi:hypothetical protein
MRNKAYILMILMIGCLTSCIEYTTEEPTMETFKVHEIVRVNGILTAGNEVAEPKVGVAYRLQVVTTSDVGVIWPGDFRYRPLTNVPAAKDSVLDSRNYYLHYGKVGAQGLTTSSMPGRKGWFRDFTWTAAGEYDVAVVLTNHAPDGPDFLQKVFDFKVNVIK